MMTIEEAIAEAKRRWGEKAHAEHVGYGLGCNVYGGVERFDGYADFRGSGSTFEKAFQDADLAEAAFAELKRYEDNHKRKDEIFSEYVGECGWLKDKTIFLCKHGSLAYGTNGPNSDVDIKGVCVPPKAYTLGFRKTFEQVDKGFGSYDCAVYGLQKFMKLAAGSNPNIIELLFIDESDWLFSCGAWEKVLSVRDSFLSRKTKDSFCGYAVSQLHRIKTHEAWHHNPPKGPQDPNWENYNEWKKRRNPARAELEEKFGYDTKHAMHLVRLLRMAREIISEGKVIVRRPDAEELKAIRNGAWTYDQLIEWTEKQEPELDELMKTSPLPHLPDYERLDRVCIEIMENNL